MNWLRKYLVPIAIAVVLFGLVIFVDVFRSQGWAKPIFDFLNRQAMVLSAAAAVTLAAAAVWAVRTTADQTRTMINETHRIRSEDREFNFKRLTLDQIVDWIIDINSRVIPPPGMGLEVYEEWGRGLVTSISSRGKWAVGNANIFGSKFQDKVKNLLGRSMDMAMALKEISESKTITDDAARERLLKHFTGILEVSDDVMNASLKIKSENRL